MNISHPKPTMLVLGARGRLGSAAVKAFAAAGWHVLAQARGGCDAAATGAQVRSIDVDLMNTAQLATAAQGANVVVYAVNPPYTEWDRKLLPLARAGMDLAARLGALFMLPGNIYAYGQGMSTLLDENTREAPTTRKGRQRQQLEAELRTRAEQGSLRSVVIRAGDFFGPADQTTGTWIDQMVIKKLPQGRLIYPGPLDVQHAWAWLPDLAQTFVAVAEHLRLQPSSTRHLRLHFEGHQLTGHELLVGLEAAAREQGWVRADQPVQHRRMRWAPIRLAGLFVPMLRELARMRYLYHVPHALDGRALRSLLTGAHPATPLASALLRCLGECPQPKQQVADVKCET